MHTKSMLMAAGIIAALTLSSPLASASVAADRPEVQCPDTPCSYSVHGGLLELNFGGSQVQCLSVRGRGQYLTNTTASTVFDLRHCREHVTVFNFRCSGTARPNRPVRTDALGTHLMVGAKRAPKLLFTYASISIVCAGVLKFHVEGYLVGHVSERQCDTGSSRYSLEPVLFAHGQMGSGPLYDVYLDADKSTYRIGDPWQMKFKRDVVLRC